MGVWWLLTPSLSHFPFAMNISPLLLPHGFQPDGPSEESLPGVYLQPCFPCPVPIPLVLKNGPLLCLVDPARLTPHHARLAQSPHTLSLPSPVGLHHLPQNPQGPR